MHRKEATGGKIIFSNFDETSGINKRVIFWKPNSSVFIFLEGGGGICKDLNASICKNVVALLSVLLIGCLL